MSPVKRSMRAPARRTPPHPAAALRPEASHQPRGYMSFHGHGPAPLPPPRPIPVALRVVYAPFYVAGLTIRYGLYYGIVVPLEVFGRALTFGYEGGVDDREGNKDGHR